MVRPESRVRFGQDLKEAAMCDPTTLAGLALTAGSTVVNTIAANNRYDQVLYCMCCNMI